MEGFFMFGTLNFLLHKRFWMPCFVSIIFQSVVELVKAIILGISYDWSFILSFLGMEMVAILILLIAISCYWQDQEFTDKEVLKSYRWYMASYIFSGFVFLKEIEVKLYTFFGLATAIGLLITVAVLIYFYVSLKKLAEE